ncbi:hypothetical protein SAMN02927900_04758 [Rhizobium mongolense subsp. loessense]|uniref:Tail tubular protein B n=1 Tax=Rhizobium mongolense subsp. loessense TaxID=158890 RepID=A0A1G4T6X9_9HYPH|nr:hypothetical protein [Rhizobium mongolense]SCW77051.1 hypothetical protein SAMN02927900_04758 [Rhizobium mongolense subsp. loessense]
MAGALISTTIPNLINGVSQQPYALRLASQCELQENAHSSVVEGLRKRPGTTHRAKITNAPAGELFTHTINRDRTEQYEIIVGNGALKVYDLKLGTEKTVAFPNGTAYLAATDPRSSFKAVTIADFTFIINRTITVAQDTTLAAARQPEAIIWVKQGSYGTKYSITLNGVTASVTTPDGSTASHISDVQTDAIAQNLITAISAAISGFTFTRNGSSIWVRKADGADFTVGVTDSQGDQAMKLVKGSVQRFSDLPAKGFDGFRVEIAGDQSSSFDNYYVQFKTESGTQSGVWVESVKGGEAIRLKASTMAHALVREANGTFTFKQVTWEDRKVGDLDSSPMPSFVGKKLNDIFFHRNRLGFIADENVVFSRSSDFFNFFRSSATQVLDTDPIDAAVSHIKVSILQHAIPFNETLLLFSEQTQFSLGATELLTPETISINQTTEFECSLKARPVGAGRNIYFTFNRGEFSGLREYYVDGDTKTNDANDVTSHVPAYVPKDISKMAASSSEDTIALLSETERNTVYIYKYYWNEQEKLQSAWYRWTFPASDTLLSVEFVESNLYLIIRRADGVFIESMPVNPGTKDTGFDFGLHLDRKVTEASCTVSYNATTNQTTITPPYTMQAGEEFVIVSRDGDPLKKPGQIIPYTPSGNTMVVAGKVEKFFLGRNYVMRYRFSTFVIKEEAVGGGQMTVGEGRIQLRKANLTYDTSGYFRVEVTPFRRDTYRYVFSGRVIGSAKNVLGQVAVDRGRFSFPLMAKNDLVTVDIINDTFLPCAFLSAEWEALYVIRSKRL